MQIVKYAFPRELSRSEIVALATSASPMPCLIHIMYRYPERRRKPECFSHHPSRSHESPHRSFKFNRARRQVQ